MPHLIDTQSRTDTMVWGVNYLLGLHGPTGVTMRALSRTTGISTSSLMHHYGNRAHILRVAAHRTGRAREQRLWVEMRARGIVAFLPRDREEEWGEARTWLAWQEIGRSEAGTALTIAEARSREATLVGILLGRPDHSDEVREVHALVEGLLAAVCMPQRALGVETAAHLLQRRADDLAVQPLSPAG